MRPVPLAAATAVACCPGEPVALAQTRDAALPAGEHSCQITIGNMRSNLGRSNLGRLQIRGAEHSWSGSPFAPYRVSGDRVEWTAGFPGFRQGFVVTETRFTPGAAPRFQVSCRTPRGWAEVMDCDRG